MAAPIHSQFECPNDVVLTTDSCELNCQDYDVYGSQRSRACVYYPIKNRKECAKAHPLQVKINDAKNCQKVFNMTNYKRRLPCVVQCLSEDLLLHSGDKNTMAFKLRVGPTEMTGAGKVFSLPINRIGKFDFSSFSAPVSNFSLKSAEMVNVNLHPDLLKDFDSITLKGINLASHKLPVGTFGSQLKEVKLHGCNIQDYPEDFANERFSLDSVSFKENQISSFPAENTMLYQNLMNASRTLDLTQNDIQTVQFYKLPSSTTPRIILSDNQLVSLPSGLASLSETSIELHRNPFNNLYLNENDLIAEQKGAVTLLGLSKRPMLRPPPKTSNRSIESYIAIMAFLGLIAITVLIKLRRCRKKQGRGDLKKNLLHEANHHSIFIEQSNEDEHIKTLTFLAKDTELASVRLAMTDVYKLKKIGSGAFGEVWIGKYKHQEVAIKCLHSQHIFSSKEKVDQFVAEIKRVSTLSHPNIVTFIGTAWTNTTNLCMITEFMNCGDLCRILHTESHIELSWEKEKLKMALDIASGLAYLHTQKPLPIIHRDLKSRNVLVDSNAGCKLTDFGLSRNLSHDETMTNVGIGTVRWTSPEIILGYEYDEFSDIYSFGVILSELDTREIPYSKTAVTDSGEPWSDVALAHQVALGKLRPDFTQDVPKDILKLAHECMQADRALRPSADAVADRLSMIKFG